MDFTSQGIVVLALSALLASGCGRKESDRTFAVVDGKEITESFLRDVILVNAKIREMSGKKVPEKDFNSWANKEVPKVLNGLVAAETLSAGLEDAGITPDTNDTALVLAKYNISMRKKARTPDELSREFGKLSEAFKLQFHRSCLFQAFRSRTSKQDVSEEEIDEYITDMTVLTNVTAEIDRKGRANAEKYVGLSMMCYTSGKE